MSHKSVRPHKLMSNACLFCKKRKRKCDGQQPCAMCVKYKKGDDCVYNTDIDKRKKKYDSATIDYLELKSDILEQYVINLIKTKPELRHLDILSILPRPPKLTSNNDTAQLQELKGLHADPDALEEMVSTAWRVRKDGDKTVFYGPLSGRQGVSETNADDMDEEEDNILARLGHLDLNFSDDEFRNKLFEIFEDTYAQYFFYSKLQMNEIKSWKFPSNESDKHLLLCSIFVYSSTYLSQREKVAKILLSEAEAVLMDACRNNLNEHVLHALLILSCYELGKSHDSNSWFYDAMCASQAQVLGMHLREGGRLGEISTANNGVVSTSPSRVALFWSIMLQDRIITSGLGRGPRIQYFRITTPFYTPRLNLKLCANDPVLFDSYISEVTFSLHSRLWYTHDRITQQIYSFKADYLHNSHRMMLLKQGFTTLQTLYNSFPDEVMLKPNSTDKRILLLHLSYYVVLILLHRSYLIQNPKKIMELMIKHCNSASKITHQYMELHGFNNAPYFVGYLIFQCAMFDLFLLAYKSEPLHKGAYARFVTFITALSEYADSWTRGYKDIKVLDALAKKWKLNVPILTSLREKTINSHSDELRSQSSGFSRESDIGREVNDQDMQNSEQLIYEQFFQGSQFINNSGVVTRFPIVSTSSDSSTPPRFVETTPPETTSMGVIPPPCNEQQFPSLDQNDTNLPPMLPDQEGFDFEVLNLTKFTDDFDFDFQ